MLIRAVLSVTSKNDVKLFFSNAASQEQCVFPLGLACFGT